MSRQLNVIIVDDEPLACEGLRLRIKQDARFIVVAQCPSSHHALVAIQQFKPDIAFVDIEMPGMSGLELAKQLAEQKSDVPKVVFVTAYSEFALKAFELCAVDYLLKPFSDQRLVNCLSKLVDGFSAEDVLQQSVSIKSGTEWIRIKLDNILWIEAAGDYMCVHTLQGSHIIRKTLKQFEQELEPKLFPRVSRSAMINLSRLQRLTPNSNGEYMAKLDSGDCVKVSRKYKFRLEELGKPLKV
jgi:two-component system LytT family response regulator